MRPKLWKQVAVVALVASGLVASGAGTQASRGDEPGRLGRLFRLGSPPTSMEATTSKPTAPSLPASSYATPTPPSASLTSPSASSPGGTGPRLVPQPRVNRPVTEADPILTRVAIGRSDDGNRFGMVLHIFADGTVLGSEGVHHVGPEALRPLVEAIQSTEAHRLRGHCGGPPTDFIEQVHLVVYERALGRLRANAFSFSGNLQGCDPAVRQLQAAIEAFQVKLGGPTAASTAASSPPAGASPISLEPAPIPLTPIR